MRHSTKIIFNILLLLMITLSSCDENKFDVELNNDDVEVNWLRLERDFTGLATKPSFKNYNDSLIDVYGGFYELYASRVMNLGDVYSPNYENLVMRFLMHKDIHQLYVTVDESFSNISDIVDQVDNAFTYYNHYFPEKHIPVMVSMVTGLSNNIVVTDSVLGVGLDMYLGDTNKLYQLAQIPEYIRKKSTPEYLPYDMLRGWVLSEFEPKSRKDDLLSQIVGYGIALYTMDALFPFGEDYLKIGFTKEEIEWCTANEKVIWSKMIEDKMLYSSDPNVVRVMTGPGPFTAGFAKESPAQVGYWIGWQIVRQYMDENKDVTIPQLIELEDAQNILRHSKYKPR